MKNLLKHYFSMPEFLIFLLISTVITVVIHLILWAWTKYFKKDDRADFDTLREEYYELVFAATSTLFFAGIYFLMDFRWISLPGKAMEYWDKYNDFILLALLVVSIVIIDFLDKIVVPLKKIDSSSLGSLRMASMVYMLVIFAYIKFIYEDNNYDTIVFYFITMLIGRFVYMDTSITSFWEACLGFIKTLPIMGLVLLSTALLALYGFKSGYLLTSNGVVVSLVIAHAFVILEIFVISKILKAGPLNQEQL